MPPAPPIKVAFLGFSEFERNSLASYFRLAAQRTPGYSHTPMLTEAERLVADADHAPSVQLVLATERLDQTVFIGARAPASSRAWLQRPIDALQVMRYLDSLGGTPAQPIPGVEVTELSPNGPQRQEDEPAADRDADGDGEWPARAPAPATAAAGTPAPAAPPAAPRTIEVAMAARSPAGTQPEPPRDLAPTLAARPGVPATAVDRRLPRRPSPHPPPRALLVDDSEVALRYLQQRLQPWGVLADTAADSAAALDLLARNSYQLVFVDVELGDGSELDGLALCREIKQSEAAVEAAVVLVSAHHSELDRVRGALAGCDAYLGKPLDETELRRLLLRHGCSAPATVVPG